MIKKYFLDPLPDDLNARRAVIETSLISSLFYLAFTLFAVYLSASNQSDALLRFTRDDGVVEWLQFLLYFSVSVFVMFSLYAHLIKDQNKLFSLPALGMLAVIALFFFGAMEEISWGQRLVGRETNAFFAQFNRQNETNLHNLVVNGVSINRLVFGKILFFIIFFHNLILPILAVNKKKLTEVVNVKLGGCYPPIVLSVFYIVGAILVELIAHERRKELLELIGGVHYLSMVFLAYGLGFQIKNPIFSGKNALLASRAFTVILLLFWGLAWCLSVSVRTC